jgi:bacillopeptidase F (M6 metalloprotease family)
MHKIKIILPGFTDAGKIEMDGKPLYVSDIKLHVKGGGGFVKVEMTMTADVEIEGHLTNEEVIHVDKLITIDTYNNPKAPPIPEPNLSHRRDTIRT